MQGRWYAWTGMSSCALIHNHTSMNALTCTLVRVSTRSDCAWCRILKNDGRCEGRIYRYFYVCLLLYIEHCFICFCRLCVFYSYFCSAPRVAHSQLHTLHQCTEGRQTQFACEEQSLVKRKKGRVVSLPEDRWAPDRWRSISLSKLQLPSSGHYSVHWLLPFSSLPPSPLLLFPTPASLSLFLYPWCFVLVRGFFFSFSFLHNHTHSRSRQRQRSGARTGARWPLNCVLSCPSRVSAHEANKRGTGAADASVSWTGVRFLLKYHSSLDWQAMHTNRTVSDGLKANSSEHKINLVVTNR